MVNLLLFFTELKTLVAKKCEQTFFFSFDLLNADRGKNKSNRVHSCSAA